MSDTLYEYFIATDDSAVQYYGDQQYACQTFTPAGHTISSVKVKLYRDGDCSPGNITVSIRATDPITGKPTGSDLCSGTTDADDLPTSNGVAEWREITFSAPVALSPDVQYAICVIGLTSDGTNKWGIRGDDSSPSYTGGQSGISTNGGSTWTMVASRDIVFYEYGLPTTSSPTSDRKTNKYLVAVASQELWYEDPAGTMKQLYASIGAFDTSAYLSMFEGYGKVFIFNSTIKKIFDLTNTKITTADLGVNPPDHGTVLTGASGAKMVVDYITSLADDAACTIYGFRTTSTTFPNSDTITGIDDDDNNIAFALNAAETAPPHFYDYTVYGNSTDYGALPDKLTLGCLYRGRIIGAGDPDNPHQWYMARQAHPFDLNNASVDAQAACAGNSADAGEIGDVVTALIPYKDDFLVFGCESSIWFLTGDPREGGSINELDLTVGIYGPQSWCWDGEGNFYFWGTNGVYQTSIPGAPTCVSEVRLPDLVNDEAADSSTHRIIMAYDRKRSGLLITITKLSDGTNSNYWLDLRSKGFFPESYPEECGVFSMFSYSSDDPDYKELVLGCYDGFLRKFDKTAKDDDIDGAANEAINSYVTFGPLALSDNPSFTGIVTLLDCILAGGAVGGSDSNDVAYELYTANSAEKLLEDMIAGSNYKVSGTFTAPGRRRGSGVSRRIKGVYAGIKLKNITLNQTWAIEQFIINSKKSGRLK